mgnify:CR=1 FL=1
MVGRETTVPARGLMQSPAGPATFRWLASISDTLFTTSDQLGGTCLFHFGAPCFPARVAFSLTIGFGRQGELHSHPGACRSHRPRPSPSGCRRFLFHSPALDPAFSSLFTTSHITRERARLPPPRGLSWCPQMAWMDNGHVWLVGAFS